MPLDHAVGSERVESQSPRGRPASRSRRQSVGIERLAHARGSRGAPDGGRGHQTDELARPDLDATLRRPGDDCFDERVRRCGCRVDDVRRHLDSAVVQAQPERLHPGQTTRCGADGGGDRARGVE